MLTCSEGERLPKGVYRLFWFTLLAPVPSDSVGNRYPSVKGYVAAARYLLAYTLASGSRVAKPVAKLGGMTRRG